MGRSCYCLYDILFFFSIMTVPTIDEVKERLYGRRKPFFTQKYQDDFNTALVAIMQTKQPGTEDEKRAVHSLTIAAPIQQVEISVYIPTQERDWGSMLDFSKVQHLIEVYNRKNKSMVRMCLDPGHQGLVVAFFAGVYSNAKTGFIRSAEFVQASYFNEVDAVFSYKNMAFIQHFLANEEIQDQEKAPMLH